MSVPPGSVSDQQEKPARRAGELRIGDLVVCRLGYGAMRITGDGAWGPPRDRENAKRVLRSAVDLGVNFIDTADSYGPFVADELIAEALYPYPPDLVIATKAGYARSGPGAWTPNGRPDHLRASCDESLKRLRVEGIALFQLHCVDPKVPFEKSLGALADLRNAGKVRNIGVSNVDLAQFRRARELLGIVSVQNRYNRDDQLSEPILEACERDHVAFIPYAPLGAGKLARGQADAKPGKGAAEPTPAQASIVWLLRKSPVMLPIPGTAALSHLRENITAAGLA